jgi:hypothetical protein
VVLTDSGKLEAGAAAPVCRPLPLGMDAQGLERRVAAEGKTSPTLRYGCETGPITGANHPLSRACQVGRR